MSSNRAALLTKLHKVLKKHSDIYIPVTPPADRTLLEQLLYACCLENAAFDKADECFARLQQSYFDWNEVRVTTIAELSETLASLPDPVSAATRLKRTLQTVFEAHYAFDLEYLKKQNIGKAVKRLEKYEGITPFAIAYVTQNALGGHAIPVDKGVLDVFVALAIVTPLEAGKNHVPGLERAIPKSKGVEFGALVHQLGADFHGSPFSQRVRAIILEVDPDAKDRLPKRTSKKEDATESEGEPAEEPEAAKETSPRSKRSPDAPKKTKKTSAPMQPSTGDTKKKSDSKRLARKKPR